MLRQFYSYVLPQQLIYNQHIKCINCEAEKANQCNSERNSDVIEASIHLKSLIFNYFWFRQLVYDNKKENIIAPHQMETFSRYWLFVKGMHRSPVDFPHKGKWPGALMFSFSSAPEQRVEQTLETPVIFMPLRSLWRHCTGHLLCGNHKGPVMRKMFPFDDVIMIMLAWFLIPEAM